MLLLEDSFAIFPFAVLDFKKRGIFTTDGVKIVNMHHLIGEIVTEISRFFILKMAAVRHLGFVVRVFGPPTKSIWWSLSLCKKLVGIGTEILIKCMSYISPVWFANAYSRPQKMAFGDLTPKRKDISMKVSKRTSLGGKTLYDV